MKTIIGILFVLLAIETWGVYGATRAKHITITCALEIGPLCYMWEENALGKLLGPERSEEIEGALLKAKKGWEQDFIERALAAKKSDALQELLNNAKDIAKKGIDTAKDALDKARDEKR
jgi:hypothetical protein